MPSSRHSRERGNLQLIENACPRPDRGLDSRFHGNDNLDYFWQNSGLELPLMASRKKV